MRRTPGLITRDEQRLEGVYPPLDEKVRQILAALDVFGHGATVTQSVRTTAQQQALYAQGRTAPGKIVTNADGVIHRSNHQVHADGFGHAVDVAFLDEQGQPTWSDSSPWNLLGEMATALGLTWGGHWKTLKDYPHLELL